MQVVWNKFPAEAFSFDPVVNYGVWRQDTQIGTKVTPKKNYTEMIQTGVLGEKYSVSGMVWTYVAQVPATKLGMYAYVAETLLDSVNATANGSTGCPACRLTCAVRTRQCMCSVPGPCASIPASRRPRIPTPSTGATSQPVSRAFPLPSISPRTAATIPITRA